MRSLSIVIMILCFLSFHSHAQECGTHLTKESREFMEQMRKTRSSARTSGDQLLSSSALVKVPIKFHALKNSAGEGGMTESAKDALMDQINNYFVNSNIEFEHVGEVNEIIDDNNYDFSSSDEGAVAVSNDVQRTVNIYFFNSVSSNGIPLCGYTRFPPSSDRVFVAYGCIAGGTTEHELGHYFTLFHTHGTTNTGTTDELVNGSNCETAGDRLCDTPADPNLSGLVNASCAYTGTAKDANGDEYVPDPSNIMSYAPDQCQNRFSNGQYARMREGFELGRSYLNFTTDDFSALINSNSRNECVNSQIQFEAVAFGAISYEWTFEGGVPNTSTLENPSISYESAGSFDVTLKVVDNADQEIVVEQFNFIKIDDPLENAQNTQFLSNVDNEISSEIEVNNPDESFTFEYSSVDRDDSPSSGSILVNNFSYFTDNLRNVDHLVFNNYVTEGVKKITISFDYAYTFLASDDTRIPPLPAVYDSLVIQTTAQCGTNAEILWRVGGDNLRTAPATLEPFVPTSSQWINKSIEVDVSENLEYIGFEFVSLSYNGNNLYLDNIQITPDFTVDNPIDFRLGKVEGGVATLRWFDGSTNETAYVLERSVNGGDFEVLATLEPNTIVYRDEAISTGNNYQYRLYADGVDGNRSDYTDVVTVASGLITGIGDELAQSVMVYPIPSADGLFTLELRGLDHSGVTYEVLDVSGKTLINASVPNDELSTLDLGTINAGIYFLKINYETETLTKRLIKK